MRTPMYFATFCALLLGCSADSATNIPDLTPHSGFFVSVDGSQTGDGSSTNPWALTTALAQPGVVMPGDTIWVHGGTYTGNFLSNLTGTSAAPVVLRNFPGERAIIDGRITIQGQYGYYWGLEVMYSDTKRTSAVLGNDPTDLPREPMNVFVLGPFNKLINMYIHDLSDGVFSGSPAEGLEIYGSIIYNNGWIGPDKGYGNNLYLQNQNATKYITDNVLFNSFSTGLQIWGSDLAYLWNFDVEGNTIFDSGDPVTPQFATMVNIQMRGAAGRFGRSIFRGNSISQRNGRSSSVGLNAGTEPPGENITFSNNIVRGRVEFFEVNGYTITGNKFTTGVDALTGGDVLIGLRTVPNAPFSANTWKDNQYAISPASTHAPFYLFDTGVSYMFPGWTSLTGYDQGSTFVNGQFSTADIIVRPNRYESGRALVTCWNWTGAATLDVDLSNVLKSGDHFEIHHVFDLFGTPIVSGTYQGGTVQIPQPVATPPVAIGTSGSPSMPDNRFNVFLVTKR